MDQAKFGPFVQVGMVVDDLDASIRTWMATSGVAPWLVFRNVAMTGHYKGEATLVKMDVALGYRGDLQLELIQVTNGAASPYLAADGRPLVGLHHLAWMTDDLDASVARAEADGLEVVFRAGNENAQVAYCRAAGAPGVLFEFIESPGTRDLMAQGIAEARAWDGTGDPVREIDFAA